MSNIFEEKKQQIVVEFIQYVYGELQMEGWKGRRDLLIAQCEFPLETDFEFDFPDDLTIWKMINNGEDFEEIISSFLFPILSNKDWMTAWMIRFQTDLNEHDYWIMWNALCEFMYGWTDNSTGIDKFDVVKNILDLEISLK
jgi:hypothetical protein